MIQYLSQQEYEDIATKIIHENYPNCATDIMSDADKFGSVVNAVMTADWKYNPERVSKYKGNASIYGYRKQRVIWAIKKIYSQKKRIKEVNLMDVNDKKAIELIPDNNNTYEIAEFNDVQNYIYKRISESKVLTDKEKKYILLFFVKNLTLEEISKENEISRKALRSNIKNGLIKLGIYNGYLKGLGKGRRGRNESKKSTRTTRI